MKTYYKWRVAEIDPLIPLLFTPLGPENHYIGHRKAVEGKGEEQGEHGCRKCRRTWEIGT